MAAATKFLTDRVAIVTASTKGIGFAIAKRLGLDGAAVVVSSRKSKNVDEAVNALRMEGIDAAGLPCHVGIQGDRKRLIDYTIERYGKLNILVSNAAVNPHFGDILSISDSQWDKMLQLNLSTESTKYALLVNEIYMKEKKYHVKCTEEVDKTVYIINKLVIGGLNGAVVFVSSVAGFNPIDGLGAYSVMKAALIGVNKALSQSLANRGIRVNAIAPGIIRTDFSRALYENDDALARTLQSIPLNRLGQAEECADTVSFLVSDDSSYITGETVSVNGGMQTRL